MLKLKQMTVSLISNVCYDIEAGIRIQNCTVITDKAKYGHLFAHLSNARYRAPQAQALNAHIATKGEKNLYLLPLFHYLKLVIIN